MRRLLQPKRLLVGLTVSLLVMALFFLPSIYLGRSNTAYLDALCSEQACACIDWDRRQTGPYQVENNVWNKGDLTGYRQCVFIKDIGDGLEAGWAWNWPGMRFNVVAYPNLIYGKNPWLPSTSADLPRRVGDIACLEAELEVAQQGSGKVNLAFDLWLTTSASARPDEITREVMIWLAHEGVQTAGSRVAMLTLDGYDIGLWKQENFKVTDDYEWTFLAFVYQADFAHGVIDLKALLSYLVDHGHISAGEHLASIQLGNEIVSGYGQTLIRSYQVRLCD